MQQQSGVRDEDVKMMENSIFFTFLIVHGRKKISFSVEMMMNSTIMTPIKFISLYFIKNIRFDDLEHFKLINEKKI